LAFSGAPAKRYKHKKEEAAGRLLFFPNKGYKNPGTAPVAFVIISKGGVRG
jgi:hypothetical protein